MEKAERYGIRMQLEDYNDIFSDFDPRPFDQKALSDDFLAEAQKASVDKTEEIDILFFLPKSKRDVKTELIIKKRLIAHFKRHTSLFEQERKKHFKTGFIFLGIGVLLMLLATLSLYKFELNFFASLAIIILEPASWFLFWEGLTMVIFTSKKKLSELIFNEKMSRARIFFSSSIK